MQSLRFAGGHVETPSSGKQSAQAVCRKIGDRTFFIKAVKDADVAVIGDQPRFLGSHEQAEQFRPCGINFQWFRISNRIQDQSLDTIDDVRRK